MATINNMLKSALLYSFGVVSLCSGMLYSMEPGYIFKVSGHGREISMCSIDNGTLLPNFELGADLTIKKVSTLDQDNIALQLSDGRLLFWNVKDNCKTWLFKPFEEGSFTTTKFGCDIFCAYYKGEIKYWDWKEKRECSDAKLKECDDLKNEHNRLLPRYLVKCTDDKRAVLCYKVNVIKTFSATDFGLPEDTYISKVIKLDDRHIALNITNGKVLIWDTTDNQKIRSITSKDGNPVRMLKNKSGKNLITIYIPNKYLMQIWNWSTGKCVRQWITGVIIGKAYHKDGNW